MYTKEIITLSCLCLAIFLIALGIHNDNIILTSLGGFCAGTYNSMIKK